MEEITYKKSLFGLSQLEALEKGKAHRQRLIQLVTRISTSNVGEKYPHHYIFSPPGLGKTFTVMNHLKNTGVRFIQVSGNVSMFAFGIQLAVINYYNPSHEKVVIFLDDCDEIFKTDANCNTMKNVLDGNRQFTYEKSLASQWKNLSDIQKEAIQYFREDGTMGFKVPTDNMVFVFASNFKLPVDDDVKTSRDHGQARSGLLAHKNAIRSRCHVADFDINWQEHWGWIADVALNTNCLDHYGIDPDDIQIILDFMWNHWYHLTERSIRTIEKMADMMRDYPDKYKLFWEIDYLKN